MSTPSRAREVTLRTALWLVLGGWLGSWTLFALAVAPTAFEVLPSRQAAGRVVGPVLTVLHLYGAVAGAVLTLLARALGRGAWLVGLPLAMCVLCLLSHFGVSAQMSEIRDLALGPSGSPELAARFQLLHRVSVSLFTALGLGALALIVLHARADATGAAGTPPGGGKSAARHGNPPKMLQKIS